jgi:hypothetical protein
VLPRLDIGGFSDRGSNPLVIQASSTDSLDLLRDPAEGELMTKEDFNALIDVNTMVDSYVAEKLSKSAEHRTLLKLSNLVTKTKGSLDVKRS